MSPVTELERDVLEMRGQVDVLQRWAETAEDKISDVRKATFGLDTSVKLILQAMEQWNGRWKWFAKLCYALVCGVGALVAADLYRLLTNR
jgi:hypothetical protein